VIALAEELDRGAKRDVLLGLHLRRGLSDQGVESAVLREMREEPALLGASCCGRLQSLPSRATRPALRSRRAAKTGARARDARGSSGPE
jgi:hypothetical protein